MRKFVVRVTYENQAGGLSSQDSVRMDEKEAYEYRERILGMDRFGTQRHNPAPVVKAVVRQVYPFKIQVPNPNYQPGVKGSKRVVRVNPIHPDDRHE